MSKSTTNSTSAERQPASNYRPCHKCHQRKIRCDKREPCSPCSRSNVQCAYPPPDQRIKRPRKTTMAKVASRLSDLERLLPSVPSTAGEEPQAIGSTHPTASLAIQGSSGHEREDCSLHTASLEHRQAFGDEILVRRGSRSQYFSEGFLARVIGRVRELVVCKSRGFTLADSKHSNKISSPSYQRHKQIDPTWTVLPSRSPSRYSRVYLPLEDL